VFQKILPFSLRGELLDDVPHRPGTERQDVRLSEVLVPEQLDFVRKARIGQAVDRTKGAAHLDIEVACGNVDTLRLDDQASAATWSAPVLSCSEQRRSNSRRALVGTNSDVPESGGERVEPVQVFTFVRYDPPHRPDPRQDLDMASFGIVRVLQDRVGNTLEVAWEPKLAFTALAEYYRGSARHS
jgi:hypothetical protein